MQQRPISDYMNSGELKAITLNGNIDFAGLQPEDDGLFVRVDDTGRLYGHRVPNQDLEWSNTNGADITLDSEKLIVELSVDEDISADNGSFLFKCVMNNGSSNRDDFVNIIFKNKDNNAIASKTVQIDKGDTNVAVTFYGGFTQDWTAPETFRIYVTSSNNSFVNGTSMLSGLKVVEARAATVTID
jgi:hypothetical protein